MTPILTGIVASGISGHLTLPWSPEGGYDALASTTLSTATGSVTFSGIPSNYKHLQIRMLAQTNRGTYGIDEANLNFNGDTSASYPVHITYAQGTSGSSSSVNYLSNTFLQIGSGMLGTTTGSNWGTLITDILDYSSINKYTTVRVVGGTDCNGAIGGLGGRVGIGSGLWLKTDAVNSITITPTNSTTFSANSSFALYGVK